MFRWFSQLQKKFQVTQEFQQNSNANSTEFRSYLDSLVFLHLDQADSDAGKKYAAIAKLQQKAVRVSMT